MYKHRYTGQELTTQDLLALPEIQKAFVAFADYLLEKYKDRIIDNVDVCTKKIKKMSRRKRSSVV